MQGHVWAAAAVLALATLLVASAHAGVTTTPWVGEDLPATAMNIGEGVANNSPVLVADPSDSGFVVMANRVDAPDFSCALQLSGNGGRTWLTADPVAHLPPGAEKCYAPEAAFDRNDTLYYLFVGLRGVGNEPMGAFVTTSHDRGHTWATPWQVLGPFEFSVRLAIDRTEGSLGRLYLLWVHATATLTGGFAPGPNPVLLATSDDGGHQFAAPIQLSDPSGARVVGPTLVLGPAHAVYVAYYDLGADAVDYEGLAGGNWQGTWSIVLTASHDGGRTFGPGRIVDDGVVPDGRVLLIFTIPPPSLVADGPQRLCAAWTDARAGNANAVARCSSDRGSRWGPLVVLNDDPPGDGKAHYQPRLAAAPDGRIDAVWYDRRNDPKNRYNDVYYTYSTDGGRLWARNMKLTSVPSNSLIGQQYAVPSANGLIEWGSRMGLLSTNARAVAAWTDTRNELFGPAQDIFSNTVTLPAATGGSPRWAAGIGAGLVAVGLAAVATLVGRSRRGKAGPGSGSGT